MLGTRGVPARYGGFETAVEEIGRRLVERGHDVTVYGRVAPTDDGLGPSDPYLGMRRVTLPAIRRKSLETLSNSALATSRVVTRGRPDAVVVFNAANAVFLPAYRAARIPVAVHVDGLEWLRSKWSGTGRHYYRTAESLSVRWADALIADCPGIADYYRRVFRARTELLTYGAPAQPEGTSDRVADLGLTPGGYHLVVARLEPENHVDIIVDGYRRSTATRPLVVVGSAPYGVDYIEQIREVASTDERIRMVGSVWDQELLDQLYANAAAYLHGHSVGGTNPSLLRAIGAGTASAVWEVPFNRDVVGLDAPGFSSPDELAAVVEHLESNPTRRRELGAAMARRAVEHFDWDDVTDGYEAMLRRIAAGWSRRGECSGRRHGSYPIGHEAIGSAEEKGPTGPILADRVASGSSHGDTSPNGASPNGTSTGAQPDAVPATEQAGDIGVPSDRGSV